MQGQQLPWFRPSQFSEMPLTTQPCTSDDNMAAQHCDNGDDRIATQYIAAFFVVVVGGFYTSN